MIGSHTGPGGLSCGTMVSFFERPFRQIGFTLCALFFGAIASEAAPDPELKAYAFEGVHMGTLFRITLYADQREKAEDAARSALERVESLNQKLSDYLPESELMKLCEQPAEKPVKVSRDLFEVLSAGKRLAANTGGGFDITAGHLTNLWRRAKRKGHLPEPEILANALKRTGYRFLTLDSDTQTATLHAEEMLLDLGGIAKGFAADAALLTLRDSGISRAIVAAGGDIAVGDPPPGEVGWPVSVSSLDAPSPGEPTVRIRIANCGISTSGDTRQSVEIGGSAIRTSSIRAPGSG